VFGQGLIPDPPDGRDRVWAASSTPRPPSKLVRWRGPVLDQGGSSQCVAFASAHLKTQQEGVEYRGYFGFDPVEFYGRLKLRDGLPGVEGTTLRAACEELLAAGIEPVTWRRRPVSGELAVRRRIAAYVRVRSRAELVDALVRSGPVLLGMEIWAEWRRPVRPASIGWRDRNGRPFAHLGFDAAIPRPLAGVSTGGHAVLVVGYRDHGGALLVKNSWGPRWGAAGYAWLRSDALERGPWDAWRCVDRREPLFEELDGG
jgi:hypothetical protein